jgi:anthranilate 1,2-dioxygenase small subunit
MPVCFGKGAMMVDNSSLRHELRDLYDDYAVFLDNLELDRWLDLFTEDAFYEVIARENYKNGLTYATMWCKGRAMLVDRVTAIREVLVYEEHSMRHFVSGVRVDPCNNGLIGAQANFMAIRSIADASPEILMVGQYVDKLVRDDGRLLFKERHCVFDNYWVPRALIVPV